MANKLVKCLIDLKKKAGLDPQQELELRELAGQFENAIVRGGATPTEQTKALAELQAVRAKLAEAKLARRQAELQTIKAYANQRIAERHPKGFTKGVRSILDAVDRRQTAVETSLHSEFAEGLSALRTRMFGLTQDQPLLRDVLRELHGTKTNNGEAVKIAQLWSKTAEKARLRFNAAGGDIRFRSDWGSPQTHEWRAVKAAGRDTWKEFIKARLDRNRMVDQNGVVLIDAELELVLDDVYETISTNGMAKLDDFAVARGSKLANRHRDSRFLVFKDGDSWIEYQDRFGQPDLFASLTGHLRSMAQEIALLEVLGPSPRQAFDVLEQGARKRIGDGPFDAASVDFLRRYFSVVSGEADKRTEGLLYHTGRVSKNILVASKLGMAPISAVSDTAFTKMTAGFNGMPAMRVFRRQLSLMNFKNEADRVFAIKLGLVAEGMTGRNSAMSRFADVEGVRLSDRVTEATMRMSGLNNWTDNLRRAFGMEMYGFLAEQSGKAIDDLPEQLQRQFEAYGIEAADWDIVRAADPERLDGAEFMRPEAAVEAAGEGDRAAAMRAAVKFQEFVTTEMDYASPMPNARIRAYLTQGTQKGTFLGEMTSMVGLFKSFPVTVVAMQTARMLSLDTIGGRASYAARLALYSTTLGALAVQAKEVLRGKDPMDMTSPAFWARAFAQGGGAGIMGDLIVNDVNRFGHGYSTTLFGPYAGLIDDTAKLTLGNVQEALRGEETSLTDELVRFASMYTPGSSLWYSRLAVERLLFDQLNAAVNPMAARDNARRAKSLYTRTGQRYWWRQGQAAPSRLPR